MPSFTLVQAKALHALLYPGQRCCAAGVEPAPGASAVSFSLTLPPSCRVLELLQNNIQIFAVAKEYIVILNNFVSTFNSLMSNYTNLLYFKWKRYVTKHLAEDKI